MNKNHVEYFKSKQKGFSIVLVSIFECEKVIYLLKTLNKVKLKCF